MVGKIPTEGLPAPTDILEDCRKNEMRRGFEMKIVEVKDRDPQLMERLLEVWENSVRATHLF